MSKAVLLISHGSKSSKLKDEIVLLSNVIKKSTKVPIFKYAFLEIAEPSIPEGIDQCVDDGAEQVIVLLNFLNSGKHVDVDIPEIIDAARQKYPNVQFKITPPVGQNFRIAEIFLTMIEDSLREDHAND